MAKSLGVGKKESFWCFNCKVVSTEMAVDVKDFTEYTCKSCGTTHPISRIRNETAQVLRGPAA